MKDIKLCSTLNCAQCGACIESCRHHAISFSLPDTNGDIYPVIDKSICVSCGSCVKSCPQIFPVELDTIYEQKYYAGWSRRFRQRGSSGGLFSELAEYVFENKGYVCGAAFDENGNLRHLLTNNVLDLKYLVGSKYLTSNVHECFPHIKCKLKEGFVVLFVGTPCQVAGLKKYLIQDYDNLILVDLVCLGCPTQEVYKAYINKLPTKKKIIGYKFRYLKSNRPDSRLIFVDGTTWRIPNKYYTYVDGFVHGYSMKKTCYQCQYKNLSRVGDITLGDYHSIRKEKPILRRRISKGVSLICVNSPKGEFLIKNVSKGLELFEKNKNKVFMTNISLREQLPITSKRNEFCHAMCDDNMSLEQINKTFGLFGLSLSSIRFNSFFIELLDLKKDVCQFLKSML